MRFYRMKIVSMIIFGICIFVSTTDLCDQRYEIYIERFNLGGGFRWVLQFPPPVTTG